MEVLGFTLRFVLAVLATWRVTHLLASEDGPADIIVRARAKLGNSFAGKLMDCFYCLSVWIAAPAALFVTRNWLEWIMAWLAVSGATCLLERTGQQPVLIQPDSQIAHGGTDHVLRTETSGTEEQPLELGPPRPIHPARAGASTPYAAPDPEPIPFPRGRNGAGGLATGVSPVQDDHYPDGYR